MEPYRSTFTSTRQGLDGRLYPMQLWQKAKKLGVWNPSAIDFARDAEDWMRLDAREQDLLLRLTAQFQGGEESVCYDLLPLLMVIAEEGRVEEELFLAAYLWEEAKHVEGSDRFLKEVTGVQGGLEHYFTDAYRQIFFEALPRSMNRLRHDPTPVALAEAAVTYQMITEGVLAETGYHAYYTVLREHDLMPGMQAFVQQVQQDESRHIAYGVFLLARLVAEHGADVWPVIETRMERLIPVALEHIEQSLAPYGADVPFGIQPQDFVAFGFGQFQKRYHRIEKARAQTLEEVLYGGQLVG